MEKDGRKRCSWATTELYQEYHDREWGRSVHDDRKLFEMLILEGMQAGLSWLTILNKRMAFREAFDQFDYQKIARYGEAEIEELMHNAGIVRNRLKIKSAITNAQQFMKVQEKLTLDGNIVLTPNFFNSIKKEDIDEKTKKMLDEMHKQKIDMSDEIYVVNVDGYIGESTKLEIEYAKRKGKKISYLESIK